MSNENLKQLEEIGSRIAELAKDALTTDEIHRFGKEVEIVELVRLASGIVEGEAAQLPKP